jgi:hypothetical protein
LRITKGLRLLPAQKGGAAGEAPAARGLRQ